MRSLALPLAMIALQGVAAAGVPEPADQAGITLAGVPNGAQVRSAAATDASLRALDRWRYMAGNSLRPAGADNPPQIPAARQGGGAPGSWALLIAGLAGALAIARRRLSSIEDRGIDRRRRGRE
jgi:hypothetical protein